MLRRSVMCCSDIKWRWILTNTDMGREAMAKAREEVLSSQKGGSRLMRFFLRRRRIDRVGLELEGPVTDQLHWTFPHAMTFVSLATVLPVAYCMMVSEKLRVSYFFLVFPIQIMPEYKYDKLWTLCNPFVVLAGQLFCLLIWFDISVYIRYPICMSIVAPIYRALGLVRAAPKGVKTVEELKQGLQGTKPLALGVKKTVLKSSSVTPKPFAKATATAPTKAVAQTRKPSLEEFAAQDRQKKKGGMITKVISRT